MKYTNYLIDGKFIDIDQMISDKKYLKELSILMGIPVALAGMAIITTALPFGVTIDTYRSLKYAYLKNYKHMPSYIRSKINRLEKLIY